MKKHLVFILASLIVFVVVMVYLWCENHKPIITKELVTIQANGACPTNNRQYQASVWLGVYDGKLYFYPHCGTVLDRTSYDGFLCVFENGGATKLTDLKKGKHSVSIQGFLAPFLYYWDKDPDADEQSDSLYCCDLQSRAERQLCSGEAQLTQNSFFSEDGAAYFPLRAENEKTPQFVCVKDGTFSRVAPLTEGYPLNGRTYYAVAEYSDTVERLLCEDENGVVTEVPLGFAHRRSVIPCGNGLLIHNESGPNILYWINEEGEVRELFSVECLDSTSAVAIHGTDVYLSFMRYKEYGDIGMKRYENDAWEGTYRISLADFSSKKISNKIYDGLYVFDDECIYACDEECSIVQMNFDGEIIRTLFSRTNESAN